eukprot:scaffold129367_cov24-Tisochrysis_lutea.AAC.3
MAPTSWEKLALSVLYTNSGASCSLTRALRLMPGTMLYPFSAMEEGEVSAAAGERVQVAMDMGDWLQ